MTPEEKRWTERLRRVLREMPKTLEVVVHQSCVDVCQAGAREACFLKYGHADVTEELTSIRADRVYPCSESI